MPYSRHRAENKVPQRADRPEAEGDEGEEQEEEGLRQPNAEGKAEEGDQEEEEGLEEEGDHMLTDGIFI